MKKGLVLMLCGVMALSMTACGSKKTSSESSSTGTASVSSSSEGALEGISSSSSEMVTDASSSSSSADEGNFSNGTISGNVYTNSFLGIQSTLPDGWSFFDEDQMKQLNSWASDNMSSDYIKEQLNNGQVYIDMYAASADQTQSENLVIQNIKSIFGAMMDIDTIVDSSVSTVQQQLQSQGVENLSVTKGTATFLGKEQTALKVSGTTQGVQVYETQAYIKVGTYLATVTATSYQQDTTQAVLDTVTSIMG